MDSQSERGEDPYLSDYETGYEDLLVGNNSPTRQPEELQPLRTEPKHGRMPKVAGLRSKYGGPPTPKAPNVVAQAKATFRAPKVPPKVRKNSGTARTRISRNMRDWGVPGYDPEDRSAYCEEYKRGPDSLRRRITQTIEDNPGLTTEQFNRLLFDTYGAQVRELNILFGCKGLAQVIEKAFNHDYCWQELTDILKKNRQ